MIAALTTGEWLLVIVIVLLLVGGLGWRNR